MIIKMIQKKWDQIYQECDGEANVAQFVSKDDDARLSGRGAVRKSCVGYAKSGMVVSRKARIVFIVV